MKIKKLLLFILPIEIKKIVEVNREKMNELYNLADAIITKSGGVTISEAINKKVHIFIHSVLPGQEEINLKYLQEQCLVFTITEGIN